MAELALPRMDFSTLGELPKVYKDARREALRERTLAELGQGGQLDYNAAAAKLLPVDPQIAMTLAQLGNNQRDFQFRQGESQRAQGNADRDYNLRRDTATTGETKVVKDANGNETLFRIDRQGNATPINTGPESTPNNPYSPGGKLNEAQSKDALYSSRMMAAEQLFRDPSVVSAGQSLTEKGKSKVPVFGNFLVSDNFQKFDQAKRDFINATLRRESGAVIADSEFANAEKQYFPQPGDSTAVLAQKAKNRAEAIRGIGAGAGPSYRPPKVLGPDNEIIDNPAAQRTSPQQPSRGISKAEYDALPSGASYTAPDGKTRTKR